MLNDFVVLHHVGDAYSATAVVQRLVSNRPAGAEDISSAHINQNDQYITSAAARPPLRQAFLISSRSGFRHWPVIGIQLIRLDEGPGPRRGHPVRRLRLEHEARADDPGGTSLKPGWPRRRYASLIHLRHLTRPCCWACLQPRIPNSRSAASFPLCSHHYVPSQAGLDPPNKTTWFAHAVEQALALLRSATTTGQDDAISGRIRRYSGAWAARCTCHIANADPDGPPTVGDYRNGSDKPTCEVKRHQPSAGHVFFPRQLTLKLMT